MAVVQISRIQQRRGKKNSSTGFPQLASGEIGWAIDTQELYIGNGAVSEGSPYVGNTQILTEHVNILDFIGSYQYQRHNPIIQTGPVATNPIQRTLQEKLDDIVNVRDFGAIGDGITDDTAAIQRAIDQLFLNDSTKNNVTSRFILYFEPGIYIISDEIRIPPHTYLQGSGINSTVIELIDTSMSNSLMRTVDSNSIPGTYTPFDSMGYPQRPRNIVIQDMTLKTDLANTILLLDNADTCSFNRIAFMGTFVNGLTPTGDDLANQPVRQTGVWMRSASGIFRPDNVNFTDCVFNKTGFGVFSLGDSNNIGFIKCQFYQLFDGINLGGGVFGSVNLKVDLSYFDLVDRYGIWIKLGYGNTSSNNKYMLVGNDNQDYANASYAILRFDHDNNQSLNDYFERNTKLKDQSTFGLVPFYPNVQSGGLIVDPTNFVKTLEETPVLAIEFFRFPLISSSRYIIDYVINKRTLGGAIRTGRIYITVNMNTGTCAIDDEFDYIGDTTVENVVFSTALEDYNGDGTKETLVLKMYNPSGNGTGYVNYTYRTMSYFNSP